MLDAMKTFMLALITAPVQALPYARAHPTVHTNAYNFQVRCVLPQKQLGDQTKSIRYWTRLPTDTEQQYDATHSKCLAIVGSVRLPHLYLVGNLFMIRIDYDNVKWILNNTNSTGRLAR